MLASLPPQNPAEPQPTLPTAEDHVQWAQSLLTDVLTAPHPELRIAAAHAHATLAVALEQRTANDLAAARLARLPSSRGVGVTPLSPRG